MGLYDISLYDLIDRNASCFRRKEAWFETDTDRSFNFSQIKERVDSLASGLQDIGIKKGDRIAVLGMNCLEYFLIYGASASLGAITLPINWRLSSEEIEYILNDCTPRLLFVDQGFQENIKGLKRNLKFIEDCFNLGEKGDFSSFTALMDNSGVFYKEDISSEDGFVIMHTAAVAGKPRGAVLSHENFLFANLQFANSLNIRSDDVHLNFIPLFHVGGLCMTLSSFQVGALNINMPKFDAKKTTEIITDRKTSVMMLFSPVLSSILEEHEKSGKDINTLQTVTGIETPETIDRYQKLTGGTFYSMYGQTETTCMTSFSSYNERPGSAGRPVSSVKVRLVDEYDHPVSTGSSGEITVKGPMVFKGYWELPDENSNTFREGWHHTGDLGRFDEEGYLWYEGRKPEKELIKPGGENVYPAEVEKIILTHPAVENVVVFGVPDPKWKEAIKAVCKLKKGMNIQDRELIDFVGERIAGYKKPRYVEFVTDFPALDDGTIDRAGIKDLYGKT